MRALLARRPAGVLGVEDVERVGVVAVQEVLGDLVRDAARRRRP
jgi:hypothetical protein